MKHLKPFLKLNDFLFQIKDSGLENLFIILGEAELFSEPLNVAPEHPVGGSIFFFEIFNLVITTDGFLL